MNNLHFELSPKETQIRGYGVISLKESVILMGGSSNEGTIGLVTEFKNDLWRKIGTLKQPRYGHSAIIFNNLIYVIGGKGTALK